MSIAAAECTRQRALEASFQALEAAAAQAPLTGSGLIEFRLAALLSSQLVFACFSYPFLNLQITP
jgi:hypothetical protein